MAAAEDVQRQVAVAAVVTVEEPALLLAVHRIVGGVEVEDDLGGRRRMRLHEQIDEQPLDRRPVVADLVVARRLRPTQLQTVQCALARQRRTLRPPRRELADHRRQHRVVPQLVVVDQVFVAQGDPVNPLTHQRRDLMLDQVGIAPIHEAFPEPIDQPQRPRRHAQQQAARVRCHPTAVERRFDTAPVHRFKSEQVRDTLCPHRSTSLGVRRSLLQNNFLRARAPMHPTSVRYPG